MIVMATMPHHERVGNARHGLLHVHRAFAWIRALSELIVQMDRLLDARRIIPA